MQKSELLNFLNANLFANRKYSLPALDRVDELRSKMPLPVAEFLKERVSSYYEPPRIPKGKVKLCFRTFNPLYRKIKPANVLNVKRRWDILSKERQMALAQAKSTGGSEFKDPCN